MLFLHTTIFYLAIGSFDEAEFIDFSKGGKTGDQSNVWTFRRLNRTDPAVMGRMHVTNFEACTLPTQTSGSKGGQTSFVRHFAQRICLIHQLRQLTATEEISDHGRQRLRIDQLLRRHAFRVHIEQGHPLFDETLCSAQTCATLVRQEFAHGSDTATSQMINIIGSPLT